MKLSDLPVGALVKDTNTKYNNATIIWQVLEHGHADDGATNTTLCSRDIITLKCFDAKEPSNSDSNRKNYGNNRYLHSNILQWLNSDATNWYTAKHGADQKPDSSNVWASSGTPINPYDTEKGFLANFSAELKAALQTVTKTTAKNTVTDGGGYESVSSKIFLLSTTEVGLANENNVAEGSIYKYYQDSNTNDRRKKNLANDAAKGNYSSATSPWRWWLRTPYSGNSYYARSVYADGMLHGDYAFGGHFGVVPAYAISSNTDVSSTTDADGAYTIVWNTLPTITTDSTSLGNKYEPFSIDYTIDDNEGDTVTYQIKMDGVTLTSGTATLGVEQTFSVTSLIFDTLSWGSHTIRITANDGSEEVYTDISFTVANKTLKVVGSIGDIGEISSYSYSLNSAKARKRVVPFSMEKANATITLSSNSVTLDSEHTSVTVNVSTNGGAISVESSDTSVATASVSNGVITISSVNDANGTATITVNTADTDNVFAGTATISVTADFLQIVSFSSGTDAQIKAMLDAYYADQITWAEMGWAVGDTRTIHLNAMTAPNPNSSNTWAAQDIVIAIVAHDQHDLATPINGHTKACITVQTREVLNNCTAAYNDAGHIYVDGDSSYDMSFTKWANLYMRTYLNNTVLGAIPSGAFKDAIKQISHYCHTAYNTADDELVTDTLFLPSYPEVFGTASYQYYTPTTRTEGTQWPYYETTANRIKYGNNNGVANSTAQYWWEESASNYYDSSTGYYWCDVTTWGAASYIHGIRARGLAPAFAM